jgi:hypothetical protein
MAEKGVNPMPPATRSTPPAQVEGSTPRDPHGPSRQTVRASPAAAWGEGGWGGGVTTAHDGWHNML